jgi:hypothetical protein
VSHPSVSTEWTHSLSGLVATASRRDLPSGQRKQRPFAGCVANRIAIGSRARAVGRPTAAAASRGNVVLFCGLGNHVDLRRLPGGAEGEPPTSAVQAPARLTSSSLPFLVGDVDHLRRRRFIRPAFEGVTSTIGRPCLVTRRSRQAIASSGSFRTVRISSFGRRNDCSSTSKRSQPLRSNQASASSATPWDLPRNAEFYRGFVIASLENPRISETPQ